MGGGRGDARRMTPFSYVDTPPVRTLRVSTYEDMFACDSRVSAAYCGPESLWKVEGLRLSASLLQVCLFQILGFFSFLTVALTVVKETRKGWFLSSL